MTFKFEGFPPGKTRLVRLPAQFFTDLLPRLDDPDELKLILFCFWALEQREGADRPSRPTRSGWPWPWPAPASTTSCWP